MPGWKAVKYIVIPGPLSLGLVVPAEVILAYVDMVAERIKNACELGNLPGFPRGNPRPLFYQPKTHQDWYGLINLCQKLAARDSIVQAPVGREYVRVILGSSVIRIRVSRTMSLTEVHRDQRMYYVSYEGEYDADTGAIAPAPDHGFVKEGAPFPPSYLDVSNYLRITFGDNNAAELRRALMGTTASKKTELKTAAVAAFLAEGARNARAFAINLMLLDLVEQGAHYDTRNGKFRQFSVDRMFWRRFENNPPKPAKLLQTAGGHIPQSGAGGADVKALKVHEVGGVTMPRYVWHHRTGFAPPVESYPRYQAPVFTRSVGGHTAGRATLSALARPAAERELAVVCMWLAHKCYLYTYEDEDSFAHFNVLRVADLNHVAFPTMTGIFRQAVGRMLRKAEMLKEALDARMMGLENVLVSRVSI
jgi:hypothetical protein